jgi:hypothetical protein
MMAYLDQLLAPQPATGAEQQGSEAATESMLEQNMLVGGYNGRGAFGSGTPCPSPHSFAAVGNHVVAGAASRHDRQLPVMSKSAPGSAEVCR